MSLKNEPCMAGPTLIDLNSVGFNCYPFMISLDKCNGSCNVVDDLSTKVCVLSETKDVNVKVLTMKTRIYEAKSFHVVLNADSTIQHIIQIKNGIIDVSANVESIIHAKKAIVGILAHIFLRIVDI